jgi:ABC-type sulfate/molybdate transport systems ATPase subunit
LTLRSQRCFASTVGDVPGTPVLEVRGLCLERGGRIVLDGVDLALMPGTVTALLGDSGAGKTSLLRCLVGLEVAGAGSVRFEGVDLLDVDRCELRRRVGFVAQTPVMLPGDVRANLAYALPADEVAPLAAALDAVGLERAFLDRDAQELSGGERARVAIARALVRDPTVLLLDEPTASLHAEAAAAVERLVAALAERGIAVVVVTHDEAQAQRVATVAVRMRAGRVVDGAAPQPGGAARTGAGDQAPITEPAD